MDNNNMLSLLENSSQSILLRIAQRVRKRRLEKNWTQKLLASKAGIPLPTYRRFEVQGEIALHKLVLIAIALQAEDEFETLFSKRMYENMDELLNSTQATYTRKKGTKNE